MAKKEKKEKPPEAPAADGAEAAPKKGLPMKLIIIAVGGLLLLGGGGFAAWKFFLAPKPEAAAEGHAEAGKAEEPKAEGGHGGGHGKAEKPQGPMGLEPFLVNLSDAKAKRYLKLSISVDAKDEKIKNEMTAKMPQIRDSIILLLSSKTYDDITPMAGKLKLRTELLKIINQSLGPAGAVHNLYFTDFVIQ
jgi:flagellar FliL protein